MSIGQWIFFSHQRQCKYICVFRRPPYVSVSHVGAVWLLKSHRWHTLPLVGSLVTADWQKQQPVIMSLVWKLHFWKDCHQKADCSIGSWLSAVWQEQIVQKSPSRIKKFVTESVRKSLSQAIKLHERPSAPLMGSGLCCLLNVNLPVFVHAPSWTMSWLQGWAAAGREAREEPGCRTHTEQHVTVAIWEFISYVWPSTINRTHLCGPCH